MPSRDVFICHASPDKEAFARPLAAALDQRAVSSWLDEAMIKPGDSITDAVNDGLRLSRYVIVIVTPELLKRPWPRKELNAAFLREIRLGEVVVIPILAADPARWADEFPLMADKLYLPWTDGPDVIAEAVARRFDRSPASEWVFEHPRSYRGPIWLRCTPSSATEHTITLRWGPLIKQVMLHPTDLNPWSMVHHKLQEDSVPFHVHVQPAATMTVGQGPPPDSAPRAINVDEGWTRSAGAPVEVVAPPSHVPLSTDRSSLADQLDYE